MKHWLSWIFVIAPIYALAWVIPQAENIAGAIIIGAFFGGFSYLNYLYFTENL